MKSKVMFTMVLFSLLLNIFHDLLIDHQVQTDGSKVVMVDTSKSIKTHHTLCDLHEVFHFSAILSSFDSFEPSQKVSRQLSFVEKISPKLIIESSFKPPRA